MKVKKIAAAALTLLLVIGVVMVSANALTGDFDRITKNKTEESVVVRPFTYSLQVDSVCGGLGNCSYVYMNGEFHEFNDEFFGTRFIVTGDTYFLENPELYDPYMEIAAKYGNPVVFFEVYTDDPSDVSDGEIYVNGHLIMYEDLILVEPEGSPQFLYYVTEPLEE